MNEKYLELDNVLDEESYEWLCDNAPKIATAVKQLVAKNLSPREISSRVVERSGPHRAALAQRCEMAAQHLYSVQAQRG